jgi:oligopeptide transport system substrate-binding protein
VSKIRSAAGGRLLALSLAALIGGIGAAVPAHGAIPSMSPNAGTTIALAPPLMGGGASQPNADPNATLTLNFGNEIGTADPQVMNGLNEIQIGSNVFSPLLTLTPKDQLAANAAESMSVSANGAVYTFKIRPGMTYSDGQPVTAADYAFAIKRACSPVVNGNYSNILFDIVGCADWRNADLSKTSKSKLKSLESAVDRAIAAPDASTLRITLTHAAGYFPYVMTTWVTYPSRPDLVQAGGANWWKNPKYYIGNGPFKIVSWTPRQQWVLARNDNYFRGKPGLAKIVYKEVSNTQTEFLAYSQNQFDSIGPDSTLLPQILGNATLKGQLSRYVLAETSWMSFNDAVAPFNNIKVRQAISYAMNRQQYINQVDNGVGKPAGTFLYPGIPGYQTQYQQTFNPARARALLAAAGYPNGNGFPVQQLRYGSDDPASKQRATFWAQQFKQILNITVQPTPTDPATLQNQEFNRDPSLKIYFGDWYEDYPHPQDWLSLVFANNSSRGPNGWNDPHFNALINKADRLPISEATPLYQQADAYLAEQTPVVFYLHGEGLTLIKPNVKGYVHYPTNPFDTTFQPEKIYKTK